MQNGFQGKDGDIMPFMPDEFVATITDRYIELFERITGNKFVMADSSQVTQRIENNVIEFLKSH
jgi:phosphoribosylaminoimidazole-succinocarboxamide synthase